MANIFNREFLEINLGGKKIPKSAIPENSEITIEYERDSMTETLRAADGTIVYHQHKTNPGTVTFSFVVAQGNNTFKDLYNHFERVGIEETGSITLACNLKISLTGITLKQKNISGKTILEDGDQHQLMLNVNNITI